MEQKHLPDTLDVPEASELLGLSENYISILCRKGYFSSARKVGRTWFLDRREVMEVKRHRQTLLAESGQKTHPFPVGTVGVTEAARRLGTSRKWVLKLIHSRQLKAVKNGLYWEIEEAGLRDIAPKPPRKLARPGLHDEPENGGNR